MISSSFVPLILILITDILSYRQEREMITRYRDRRKLCRRCFLNTFQRELAEAIAEYLVMNANRDTFRAALNLHTTPFSFERRSSSPATRCYFDACRDFCRLLLCHLCVAGLRHTLPERRCAAYAAITLPRDKSGGWLRSRGPPGIDNDAEAFYGYPGLLTCRTYAVLAPLPIHDTASRGWHLILVPYA